MGSTLLQPEPPKSSSIAEPNHLGFLRFYLFIFRERGREEEREGEKHQCVVASHMPPNGDLACNPGMCPNWELNQQPFGSQVGTQSTEPHQPGQPTTWVSSGHYQQVFLVAELQGPPPATSMGSLCRQTHPRERHSCLAPV